MLWGGGNHVVIPGEKVMEILHGGHPGESRMKRITRNAVWWAGVDADIERKVNSCVECQVNQGSPHFTHGNGHQDRRAAST